MLRLAIERFQTLVLFVFPLAVTVEFDPTSYTVSESDRYANITVVKRGQTTQTINVTFTTVDGSATGEYLGGDCNHCPIEPFLSSLVQLDRTTTQYHRQ